MATKRMLIDASHPEETRVVVLSGNQVEDFDVEVESRRQLKGNVYLAKVTRVEPSLQAAFVEYGGNRHGFLAFSEIHPDYYQIPVADRETLIAEEEDAQLAAKEAEEADESHNGDVAVEEVGGGEDAIDDAESVRRPVVDRRRYKIQEVIKRRQILLIQVVKEERGNKGAALTTYLSLAGRYCVLMPNTARGGGISRKIASGQDRKRLKSILADLSIPDGMAVIVRTAGDKRTKAEIKRDYEYLIRLWEQIRQKTLESIAPSLIHEEGNLIKRSIRDIYTKDIEEVVIHGEEGYRVAKDFMKLMMPSHAKRVQPYKEENIPLLQRYQVESQIDSMHHPEVTLKSGGYIVINSTEALVAVDVNSGKSTRERNIEETAYKTNLEAADEVARQLRLRDLAGLIVIDFIDMENNRNQNKVERALKDAMRKDRARIQIGRISPFGLLEMSRQRLRPSLQEIHSEPCPHCVGTGIRRSADTTALQILRVIEEEAMRKRNNEITMHVPTEVALYILNQKRDLLTKIEADFDVKVFLLNDDTLIPPDYRMDRIKSDGAAAETQDASSNDSNDNEDGGRKRRPRRRRRRGKGGEDQTDQQQDAQSDTQSDAQSNDTTDTAAEPSDTSNNEENKQQADGDADGEDGPKRPRRRRRGRRAGRNRNRNANENNNEENNEQSADNAGTAENGNEGNDSAPVAANTNDDATSKDSAPVKADVSEAAPSEPAATDDAGETPKEKPKRRPRVRRSKKVETTEDTTDAPASEDVEKVEAEAEAPVKEKPKPRARRGNGKSKTTTETVTVDASSAPIKVTPPAPVDTTPSPTAKTTVIDVAQVNDKEKKTKRGWWRRD
jgi:ribonuclease E